MVVKRRKKSSRAHNLHNWGRNKHRGSGNRAGFGNAGTGKKCDSQKTSIWKEDYFGRYGFVNQNKGPAIRALSLRDLEDKLPAWIADKKVKQEAGVFVIHLEELGYHKLLGTGHVTKKLRITVTTAAANATEKVKAAGGELVIAQ